MDRPSTHTNNNKVTLITTTSHVIPTLMPPPRELRLVLPAEQGNGVEEFVFVGEETKEFEKYRYFYSILNRL